MYGSIPTLTKCTDPIDVKYTVKQITYIKQQSE